MIAVLITLMAGLTVHVGQDVRDMTLVVVDQLGNVVEQMPAPAAGDYVFEELADGSYTVRAVVEGTVVASVSEVVVPTTKSIEISVNPESLAESQEEQGARRNQNIQVNLVDTQALIESLGRAGARVRPVAEFSAVRPNYAYELGGVGRSPQLLRASRQSGYHGEIYETHNNNVLNARTFFQVGSVEPSRMNQYGFRFGGPMGSDKLSFLVTGQETRESGFVNGNVLVPLPNERASTATDPAIRALIDSWLALYPTELPNRTEIDPRMLNTNALQKIRNTVGTFRLDWNRSERHRLSARYSYGDNFIDSFELVIGQNPNQRLRPQTLNLASEHQVSDRTLLRVGFNYLRRKVHVLVSPSIGPNVNVSRDIQSLGPSFNFPVRRMGNDFEYLAQVSTSLDDHQIDWGGQVQRAQLNEFQADGTRGTFSFTRNFGRTAIENFVAGALTRYTTVLGDLYRGFRYTNFNLFVNDRIRITPDLHLTLGLRYQFAGKPNEVNQLTSFPHSSDANNFAPRIGLAYASGPQVLRLGYGISYGNIFPATFRTTKLNPPEVIRMRLQSPDILDPLKDVVLTPGVIPPASRNFLDPELVAPYSHQYTVEFERELPGDITLKASYIGSRTWKLFRGVRENRGEPVEGIPFRTSTINERRPDPTIFSIARLTNQARGYFDAGQFSIDKTFGRGLALRGAYTWSKALDTGSDFSSPGTNRGKTAQNENLGFSDVKSRSNFDTPHSFVLGYSFEFPGRVLGGWVVSGTTILKSGTPFSVTTGSDAPPFGNADGESGDRPSILDLSLLGRSIDDPDTSQQVLVAEAFDPTAPSRNGYGNLSANMFRKDGTTNFNVAISRTFSLSSDQTHSLLFRTEFINAFNHPQFSPPNGSVASTSFGQITNTLNAGRIIQFHLRLGF